ncbi:3',5'-cyclic AMP phosphodiesterase CpdA [Asanoa hainanensis]|uniref:3',5'-cyclic AMP phosphodiesterase CpdA n=1 Tax=Asanoa hainanensis TaxID=560556 RepID=A0A239P1H6_9ACTN|nr:metallophosphoesterase [Asanoa hainanensis]SNT60935.1 3',5'-cyclic AMP phosphodiesterase CpdA [Asanoa hainanensis]
MRPGVYAISDLHVGFRDNRTIVEELRPRHPEDWLLVAGDVGDYASDVAWTFATLRRNFGTVIWAPGNHELWTLPDDPVQLRGVERYEHLVSVARQLGVRTPEDPYAVWRGSDGPVTVAPLFLLYDYTFRPAGCPDAASAIARAYAAGVVCTDEVFLHPDPHATRQEWCAERLRLTEQRLSRCDPSIPTLLVNHFPLVRQPTLALRHPEFAIWCGTDRTSDWHLRFGACAVVYGHLHIPRSTRYDGVPFEEVSVGYPYEWRRRHGGSPAAKAILPPPE